MNYFYLNTLKSQKWNLFTLRVEKFGYIFISLMSNKHSMSLGEFSYVLICLSAIRLDYLVTLYGGHKKLLLKPCRSYNIKRLCIEIISLRIRTLNSGILINYAEYLILKIRDGTKTQLRKVDIYFLRIWSLKNLVWYQFSYREG